MARKTYPETPQEEAARINRASGDPEGITAEQVANNRKINERLTAAFGFGGDKAASSGPSSNPTNPFSQLVAGISEGISRVTNEGQAALQNATSALEKAKLDDKISDLSAGFKSGLNQMAGDIKDFGASALGGNNTIQSAVGGAVDKLRTVAGSTSNLAADITGTLNKLTGGNLAGGLMKAAGSLSASAGMLNNILSLKRGVNIPKGAQVFAKQGQAIQLNPGAKDDWRVRITCQWDNFNSDLFKVLKGTGGVVWPYMPNITVSTKAEYNTIPITHANYSQYSYKNSVVDDITISGEFSCETASDGDYWIAATTFFKTATKMFFGEGNLAGNPPIICNLTGYGSHVFDKVPVIIKSFSVDLKDDVNYIKCDPFKNGKYTWVPVLSTITVQVAPVYSRQGLRKFNLQDYASGKMSGAGKDQVGYI
jgi:hypothetical protein